MADETFPTLADLHERLHRQRLQLAGCEHDPVLWANTIDKLKHAIADTQKRIAEREAEQMMRARSGGAGSSGSKRFNDAIPLAAVAVVLYDHNEGGDYPWKLRVRLYEDPQTITGLTEKLWSAHSSLGDALTALSNIIRTRQIWYSTLMVDSAHQPPLLETWTTEEILRREA